MVDQALIEKVKNSNQNAFKMMYDDCIRYVYSIVKRYVSNHSDHQDIIQEIFARIFLSINSYDVKKGDFKFWIRRITINQCLQHYNKQKASHKIVSLDSVFDVQSNDDEMMYNLTKEEILELLQKMPTGYRQIFMLVVLDGFSHNEVSKMLEISPETSRSQLHWAKKWFQKNFSNKSLKIISCGR